MKPPATLYSLTKPLYAAEPMLIGKHWWRCIVFAHERYGRCTEYQWVRACNIYDGDRWHSHDEWPTYNGDHCDGGMPKSLGKLFDRNRAAIAAALQPEFSLRNGPPAPRKASFENNPSHQRTLLAGLDCLPGQLDLFHTDGE